MYPETEMRKIIHKHSSRCSKNDIILLVGIQYVVDVTIEVLHFLILFLALKYH